MSGVSISIVPGAVAAGGALLLVAAGVGHLRHPGVLRDALAAQRVLPAAAWSPLVAIVTGTELLAGSTVLVAGFAVPDVAIAGLAVQSVLYAAFTGYLRLVWRRHPGAPCGCLGRGTTVNRLVIARCGVLAGGSGIAAASAGAIVTWPGTLLLVCLAGGLVVAMAGWLLPELWEWRSAGH